jgi:phosphoglycolate phosphatase
MLIIFDWDGTILDSSNKIVSCMQAGAVEFGVPPRGAEDIRNIIGLELSVAIASLYPELNAREVEELRAAYVRNFILADRDPCKMFVGVDDSLRSLKAAGHDLCVATGKSRRGLDRVFSGLPISSLFSASRCADETASKPDPLMLAQLCAERGAAPESALMVGDTEYDLEMARKIAMPSVGVSYGVHSIERLQRWQPVAVIDQFAELLSVVEGLNA